MPRCRATLDEDNRPPLDKFGQGGTSGGWGDRSLRKPPLSPSFCKKEECYSEEFFMRPCGTTFDKNISTP